MLDLDNAKAFFMYHGGFTESGFEIEWAIYAAENPIHTKRNILLHLGY